MKKIVFVIILLVVSYVQAQIHDPVKWVTSVEKLSDTEYKLIAKASVGNYIQHYTVI